MQSLSENLLRLAEQIISSSDIFRVDYYDDRSSARCFRTKLRANGVEVFIPREASCISACVLILAGGATRTITGKVGIDYPHFLRAAGLGDDVPALLSRSKQIMRDYFRSMGVDEELADAMFTVPSGSVRILRQDELSQYRLIELR